MCGIAGFSQYGGGLDQDQLAAQVRAMADTLARRGPDDAGQWCDVQAGLALGHRRLSIIDLSPSGAQPMLSHDGRYVLVFNGEIYNFLDLKKELEGLEPELAGRWQGHSDSEVLIQAWARWGAEKTLKKAWGMFALAVWDRETRRLILARDRLGKKPLFYGWQDGLFFFASELKAVRAHPRFAGRVDRQALGAYLRRGNVPGTACIYEGMNKLRPGCWLEVDPANPNGEGAPRPYWSALEAAMQGQANPFAGNEAEARVRLEELLGDAVARRLISDVPLGALLSGGVDSSLVVAMMSQLSAEPVRTFTIGFSQGSHDEAAWARQVAGRLGSRHTELYLAPEKALELIPQLPVIYDEPFADSSALPTCLVSALARSQVTVALSGDGGDELFGGYERYQWTPRIAAMTSRLPGPLRALAARALRAGGEAMWARVLAALQPALPKRLRKHNPADNLSRLAEGLAARDPLELYDQIMTLWPRPHELVLGLDEAARPAAAPPLEGLVPQLMYLDAAGYMCDDILTKVDRASMAVSLEMRCPLLDHRVYEFAWSLPLEMKIAGGQGKAPLKRLLARSLPAELIERPKMGFGVPLADWLRGPLREWASDLLSPELIRAQGYLRAQPIVRAWQAHLSGRRDLHHHLWAVLMFQAWLAAQDRPPAPPAAIDL